MVVVDFVSVVVFEIVTTSRCSSACSWTVWARRLRRQMERWMQRVEQEYDVLRTQVESTVSHAADQLDKAGAALKEVGVLLEAQDVALDSLAQAYADSDLTKVKAPMPIPES